ncbi:MAG: pyridoxamine 5'-phosphate oxidase family protein [Actinobacteria bacterium]|nr:pyridoxamine 5'-phosphate oxidase family protein [Actinomycetota bacterium]
MASRRAEITMNEAEVRAYLDSQQILNVATIGPTGHPHIVAMWYAFVDDVVCFWTFAKSQKIQNLRRDSKMSGLVESGGGDYNQLRGVELVGSGRIIDDYESVLAIGKAVAVRYNGEVALSDAALPFVEAQARKRLGVAFDVSSVVSWDHTKLGSGY